MESTRQPNEHARAGELYSALHTFAVQSRPGTPLPSENALARKYQMARMTVRKALQRVADEGLIERRRGAGSFVKGKRIVTLLMPCPEFLSERYAPYNADYLLTFQGVMRATMELGMTLEMVAVTPNNKPDYIDYSQLSEIHAGSLVIASNWFCKLYEFLVSKGAQVAILGSQSEHYGFRHFHREFYTVDCDRRQAVRQILDYLYAHGKRRIALAGCYLDEKLHPVHDAYVEWCATHQTPELLYHFPAGESANRKLTGGGLAQDFKTDGFDALVVYHHSFRNATGCVQEVLGLPAELPVFGIAYHSNFSPDLKPFPYCRENSEELAYEAVKLLAKGGQRGTVLTFPDEFHNLPDDWADWMKEYSSNNFFQPNQTKEN